MTLKIPHFFSLKKKRLFFLEKFGGSMYPEPFLVVTGILVGGV